VARNVGGREDQIVEDFHRIEGQAGDSAANQDDLVDEQSESLGQGCPGWGAAGQKELGIEVDRDTRGGCIVDTDELGHVSELVAEEKELGLEPDRHSLVNVAAIEDDSVPVSESGAVEKESALETDRHILENVAAIEDDSVPVSEQAVEEKELGLDRDIHMLDKVAVMEDDFVPVWEPVVELVLGLDRRIHMDSAGIEDEFAPAGETAAEEDKRDAEVEVQL
jgi:hypothetical protein